MAALQSAAVNHEAETYSLFRRVCPDCHTFRPVKDYTRRRIRTVFGTVEVRNPRWMLCRNCNPGMVVGFAPPKEICPDRATPELTKLTAMQPCARSQVDERHQLEMQIPGDRRKGFVISIDTAHVRSADPNSSRNFELVVVRCGRGGRGEGGGRYFVTGSTDQSALRDRTLHALRHKGYCGFGDITVISDGAEILKQLPRAMPKPTAHILDWFQIAMKIQPMQQIADHIVRSDSGLFDALPPVDKDVRAVRRRLWHGHVDRAIRDLERLLTRLKDWQGECPLPIVRLHSLGSQILTYVHSNRGAIVNYGERYRVASTLAESAVNSLLGQRIVKKQQMRWSSNGAHLLMQVRTADLNGELRNRLCTPFRQPEPNGPPLFKPKPPLPTHRIAPLKLPVSLHSHQH
ncbi:ISKra4 family transposase [Rhizobium freirei]|nr:ISKra4 family transposase [Rhizobium freirei]